MAQDLQFKRGTTASNSIFTGLDGELSVDTTKKTLVVHDGATAGGSTLATESFVTSKNYLQNDLTNITTSFTFDLGSVSDV